MKPISIIILLLVLFQVHQLPAQNFTNITSPGVTYFSNGSAYMRGYRYDTVMAQGGDSIYLAPAIILDSGFYDCADTNRAPVLSRKIIRKTDGTFNFLKKNGDTVLFLSQATINQVWICCQLPGNRRVEAQVTDIRNDSVVDTTDVVKEITFTARDQNGTIFPHPINGKKIILSEHYGFVTTIDWWLFPDSTQTWKLEGKGDPVIGRQDFSYLQCYDFEPGDVFHYFYSEYNGIVTIREIENILDKVVYGIDSTVYTIERCSHKIIAAPPAPVYQNVWDTVTQVISGNSIIFTSIPEQFLPVTITGSRIAYQFSKPYETFNGREEKMVTEFGYYFPDSCWTGWNGTVDTYSVVKDIYSKGLGKTYHFFDSWDGPNHQLDYMNLVYYKKGSEEWGTPLATNCSVIVPVDEKVNFKTVLIFPNPVVTSATITINDAKDNEQFSLLIMDITGRIVKNYSFSGPSFYFGRENLPSGLYLFKISGRSGFSRTLRVVVL